MSSVSDRDEWQRMIGEDLKELLDLVENTDVAEIEVADGDRLIKIRVDRSADPLPENDDQTPVETVEPISSTVAVTADRVGTFYRSAEGEEAPLKSENDEADAGQAIAFIDSLNVWHEVASPRPGRIISFDVDDGSDVEYGQQIAVMEIEEPDSDPQS